MRGGQDKDRWGWALLAAALALTAVSQAVWLVIATEPADSWVSMGPDAVTDSHGPGWGPLLALAAWTTGTVWAATRAARGFRRSGRH